MRVRSRLQVWRGSAALLQRVALALVLCAGATGCGQVALIAFLVSSSGSGGGSSGGGAPPATGGTPVQEVSAQLSLSAGPSQGGDAVVARLLTAGAAFTSSPISVTVAGAPAVSVTRVSDTEVSFVVPPNPDGNRTGTGVVEIRQDAMRSGNTTFRWQAVPHTVTGFGPTGGPTTGGTTLSIQGTGFVDDVTVTLGGATCTLVSASAGQLVCRTPPSGTPLVADLIVQHPEGFQVLVSQAFTYTTPPPPPPPPPTAPATPTGLVLTTAPTQVDLAWVDQSGNEQGFRVERRSLPDVDLAQWVPEPGQSHTGVVVPDPLRADNQALTLTGLGSDGDLFSAGAVFSPSGRYEVSFEYLGLPQGGSVPGDLGGAVGVTAALPVVAGQLDWVAGTADAQASLTSGTGLVAALVDDGQWRRYSVMIDVAGTPLAGSPLYLTVQDSASSGGVAGDVYFDDLALRPVESPPTPFVALGTVVADLTTWADTTVSLGASYEYQVVAFNAVGDSAPSSPAKTTTPLVATVVDLPFFGALLPVRNASAIWVLDYSGSMAIAVPPYLDAQGALVSNGDRRSRMIAELDKTLALLPPSFLFNVVAFNQCVVPLWPQRRPATPANIAAAMAFLSSMPSDGWTNTSGGAVAALAEAANQTVILVSDGDPNFLDCGFVAVGTPAEHRTVIAAANTQGAWIHSCGLAVAGQPVAQAFMQDVAADSGGVYFEPDLSVLAPVAPTGLSALPAAGRVDLTWTDASTTETGFRVERRGLGAGSFAAVAVVAANATSHLDVTALLGTSYEYRVLALSGTVVSAPSNVAAVTTPPSALSPPTGLSATGVTTTRVDLTWTDTSASETGFRIERSSGGGPYLVLGSVPMDATSFPDTSGAPSTAYSYRVRAVDASGGSAPSNVALGVTLASPAAPSPLTATPVDAGRIDLLWTDTSPDETGFRVERSLAGAGAFVPVTTVGAGVTAHMDTGLLEGTSYDYRVVAETPIGDTLPAVATATTPLAPVDPTLSTAVASHMTRLANGVETVTITVTARAADGSLLAGRTVTLTPSGANNTVVQPGPTDAVGVASGTLATNLVETKTITVVVAGVTLAQQPMVDFVAVPSAAQSSLTLSPARVEADGVSTTTVTVTVRDAGGNPLSGRPVTLVTGGNGNVYGQPGPTDVNGVTTGTLASAEAGTKNVVAVVQGTTVAQQQMVTWVAVDASTSSVSLSPTSLPADGASASVITVTVLANDGLPLVGKQVTLAVSGGGNTVTQPALTDANGVAQGSVTSTLVGLKTVTATVSGVVLAQQPLLDVHPVQNHVLRFDGGDAIDLVANSSYDLGTQFTFECWVKLASYQPYGFVFCKWRVALEDKILAIGAGYPTAGHAGPDTNITAPSPIPLDRWTHVAGVLDGSGMRMYVDGTLVASNFATGDMKDSTGSPRIGRYFRDSVFKNSIDGLLDEVRLSRVARYTADFTPPKRLARDADTILLFHFDEGSGTSTADASPNGNTGTLAAGAEEPQWVTEEIVVADADLETRVLLPGNTIRAGQLGVPVTLQVDNLGSAAADLQGAQLTFDEPGFVVTRTDSQTSVPAFGQALLTFDVDVPGGIALAPVQADAALQATDAVNGANASLVTATARGSWTVVDWLDYAASASVAGVSNTLAGDSRAPSLAVSRVGDPSVAWAEGGATPEIHLRRWDGAAWSELGGSATGAGVSNTLGASTAPQLALLGVDPVVAWQDDTSGADEVYLRRWDGMAWVELAGSGSGGGLSNTAASSTAPALAIDAAGAITVAWSEDVAGAQQIYLRRWDGMTWAELGGSATSDGVSGTAGDSTQPALALTAAGDPVLAWLDTTSGGADVYLRRWDGMAWVELGGSATSGGVSASTGLVHALDLDVTRAGLPCVAWADDQSGAREIYLRQWDGMAWVELGGSASLGGVSDSGAPSRLPAMRLDEGGRPLVAWQEEAAGQPVQVFLARWNGTTWLACAGSTGVGGASETAGDSLRPSLALLRNGHPVLAWEDLTRAAGVGEVLVRRGRAEFVAFYDDFSDDSYTAWLMPNGRAGRFSDALRLTSPSFSNEVGTAFYREELDLRRYRARFSLYQGQADGTTLATIRGSGPNLLGGPGGGLGVLGLDGYATEFDSWGGPGDISTNQVGFTQGQPFGPLGQVHLPTPSLRFTQLTAEVIVDQGQVQIYLESATFPRALVFTHTEQAAADFVGYLGLTAASGGVTGEHTVDDLLLVVEP
jgi:Concanavalin A-like lectin/glucanases superfamily/Bacterial Ig-like domain (group 1)/IPT/TIG domain/Fibronectin type III domain